MYVTRKVAKGDLAGRWVLPDRVFFACGACHILAYAVIERYPEHGFQPTGLPGTPQGTQTLPIGHRSTAA